MISEVKTAELHLGLLVVVMEFFGIKNNPAKTELMTRLISRKRKCNNKDKLWLFVDKLKNQVYDRSKLFELKDVIKTEGQKQ